MEVTVKKLSEENIEDFLYFFDHSAFCDNPDWAGCYCRFYYFSDNQVWENKSPDANRLESISSIKSKKMNGYLAYIDGAPVGWCNADDILNYPRILEDGNIDTDNKRKAAAVVCFVTEHKQRRKGIAGLLLKEVCSDYRKLGYDYIEAYPRKTDKSDAGNYHGPLSLYISLDFKVQKELEDFFIVRKNLR